MRSAEFDQSAKSPRINYVIAPEWSTGSMNMPTPEPEKAPEKKSKKGLLIGITAGLAGAAVAAAAIMGVNASGETPQTQPTAEAPADPREVVPEAPEVPAAGELLPADMDLDLLAGLSSEELGQAFIDRYNAWGEAGSNNAAILDEQSTAAGNNISMGEFVTGKAQQFAPYFADLLFVPDWRDRPDLVNTYESRIEINAHRLELNIKTSNPAFGDEEAWSYVSTVDAVREVASDGTTRTLEIDFTDSNNAEKNGVGEDFAFEDEVITVPYGTRTVTFVTVDGVERIAATSVTSRQQ